MKRLILIIACALAVTVQAGAQNDESNWTLNTRAWSSNYFTSAIYGAVKNAAMRLLLKDSKDSLLVARIAPTQSTVFPVGLQKKGFDGDGDIYSPYHRAFANPLKHIGDYGIGVDASWTPSVVGAYAGAYFKSQEICAKETDDNLRGFYFQPRAGLSVRVVESCRIEAGAFYDVVTGCGGSWEETDKDMLKGGLGLDFGILLAQEESKLQAALQFSMPLHNFLNEDYDNGAFKGMKRRVGYIMLTGRIAL